MSQSDYYNAVTSAIMGVWSGALGVSQGTGALIGAAQTYLSEAWAVGARRCGIAMTELTETERSERINFILTQQAFAGRLMREVYQHRERVGGSVAPYLARATIWAQRYHHAVQLAQQMACADRKAVWVYGDTLEHCDDCRKAEGRVHRRSIWQKYGWMPGSRSLSCGGWRCDCRLEDTDQPALPGHPPYVGGL